METKNFLKWYHSEILPSFGKDDFLINKVVKINSLYANQPLIELEALNRKLKGKNLSICYVVEYNNKQILIDGHHTVIAKKIKGNTKVKVKYLKLN